MTDRPRPRADFGVIADALAPRFDAADCAAQGHEPADHIDPGEVRPAPSPPFTRPMPDLPLRLPAADAYVIGEPLLSYGQLRDRMAAEHQQCALEGLCCDDPAQPWHACHMFALARIRGVCHTTHITITADAPARFLVVDITTDGPAAACGGTITEASSYIDAIRAITADLFDEWPND